MIRILIADDHAILRQGLKQILLDQYPTAIIEEANDAEEMISKTMTGNYKIIICDLSMPGRIGLEVLPYIKQNFPQIPVLILSLFPEEQYAIRAMKRGASGYISKMAASADLLKAVKVVCKAINMYLPSWRKKWLKISRRAIFSNNLMRCFQIVNLISLSVLLQVPGLLKLQKNYP